jgi:predicted acetyltransferase
VFSHLYPFSHDYYRKFGYEPIGSVKKYTLPLEPARKLKNNGAAYEFIKGDGARNKLIEVYESYASRHNVMLSRSENRWNEVFDVKLFGPDRLYYWKDRNGDIKSWVKFKKDGGIMEIRDIAWIDHESMLGILQFMGMFEGAAEKMRLRASPEFVPELYWNNLYDTWVENEWLGMNRVVDAKRALELMKKPDCDGKFTIKVMDKFAKWNNNTYIVEYGGGDCSVKTADAGVSADVETSELALVLMVFGVYDFEQVAKKDDVCVNGNIETLKQAFVKKPILIADYF